jgi:ankyrin repeat protein
MSSPFSRELPARPDVDQQRKLAKELLRAFRAGTAEAVARFRNVLPDKSTMALADAQFVLAREYGFASWSALVDHTTGVRERREVSLEEVHEVFARRDARTLRRLLEQHSVLRDRINDHVFAFDAPALVACAADEAMVEVLLDFGADPNRKSSWWAGGFHPLHAATQRTAQLLMEAGAVVDACSAAHLDRLDDLRTLIASDPQCVHMRGGDGQTPLHFARSVAAVDLLLAAGADIDARDLDHRGTPAEWMLHQRRGAGRYALADYLVSRGASVDLFLAAALGLTDRARKLLDADPDLLAQRTGQGAYGEQPPGSHHIYFWTIGSGRSPLDTAAQFEHKETQAAMRRYASPVQHFVSAARAGDETTARALLRERPSLVSEMNPRDHRALADAAWAADATAVALMIALGFDPHVTGHDSGSALHCAAWQGSVECVRAILNHPRAPDLVHTKEARYGATALGWCCHGSLHGPPRRDHATIARLLIEAGAQPGPDTTDASDAVLRVLSRG